MAETDKVQGGETMPETKRRGGLGRFTKGVAIVLIILVIGIVIGYVVVTRNLNAWARSTVQTMGPRFIGVDVAVDEMSVQPLIGGGGIKGLTVANPEGFRKPHLAEVGEGSLHIDIWSLLRKPVVVHTLEARDASAVVEVTGGRNNIVVVYQTLADRLGKISAGDAAAAPEAEPGAPEGGGGTPPVSIGKLALHGGSILLLPEGDSKGIVLTAEKGEVSTVTGLVVLSNVTVSSPAGYEDPHAMVIDEIRIQTDPATLFADTIVIESINIDGVRAVYATGTGGNNILLIQKKIEEIEQTLVLGEGEGTKELVIRELNITGAEAKLSALVFKAMPVKPTLRVPDIHLENVRGDSVANTLLSVSQQIFPAFAGAGESLASKVGEVVGKGAEKAVEGVQKVGETIGEGGKKVGEGVKKGLEGLGEGIGGLFGGDKSEE